MRKQNKIEYNILASDLELPGLKVSYNIIEIGTLGHFAKDSCDALVDVLHFEQILKAKEILIQTAEVAIVCSQDV